MGEVATMQKRKSRRSLKVFSNFNHLKRRMNGGAREARKMDSSILARLSAK